MSEPEGPGPPKGSSWPSDGGTAPEVHSEATGLNLIGGSEKEHASSVRLGAPNETETGVELDASSPDADLASSTSTNNETSTEVKRDDPAFPAVCKRKAESCTCRPSW